MIRGRKAEQILDLGLLRRGKLALVGFGLIQVREEIVARAAGRGGGPLGAALDLPRGVSEAPPPAVRPVGGDLQLVFVVQGHALHQVVQQLRGHRLVDPGAGGDEGVHVVHALDVACSEALAGLPAGGLHLCGGKK